MWHKTFSAKTTEASQQQVWKVLTDISRWNEWDPDLEWTNISGEAKLNTSFFLKPKGGPKTRLTITRLDKPEVFAEVAHLPLAKMHTVHTLTETPKGLDIRVDIEITGILSFLWSRVIGQKQIDGGPDQTRRLILKSKNA